MSDERIRVLFFIDRFAIGGAQRQLLNLLRGIDKERFRCKVISIYRGGVLEAELGDILELEGDTLDRRGKLDPRTPLGALRAVRRFGPHVVYCLLPVASVFGLSAALACGTPVRIASKRTGGRRRTSVGDGMYRWAEIRLMKFAHAIVANSEAGQDFLTEQGVDAAKVHVILNGLDAQPLPDPAEAATVRRQLGAEDHTPLIGMVASLTAGKDHETLLRAFGLLLRDFPDARLALVGDGPRRQALEDLAAKLGLDGQVVFVGNESSLGPFYAAFDVLALSSGMPEGCSNVLLEAMALGRPVVVTDAGGNRELVTTGETGFLVPRRRPRALAASIVRALTDREEAARMASRARDMVLERYSLEGMVTAHEELFRSLFRARREAST